MNSFQDVVEAVKKYRTEFDAAADTDRVKAAINEAVAAERAKYSVEGIFTGSESGIREYERTLKAKASTNLLMKATTFEDSYTAALETFATVRKSHETITLPSQSYKGTDAGTKAMLRAADAMETHGVYLATQGQSFATFAEMYAAANDADQPVLTALVEQGEAQNWRSFPVSRTKDDAAAILKLRDTIAAKKAARVPAELVAAEQDVRGLMTGVTESRIRLAKAGKLALAAG